MSEDQPSFDVCEAAGLDGTLRDPQHPDPYTWREVAEALLARKEERA